MKIVTVCVNYSRYLSRFFLNNFFHNIPISVITSKQDVLTKKKCLKNNVDFFETDIFYKNGSNFNKGAAINEWLLCNRSDLDWVIHIDSDCILPFNFLNIISSLSLSFEVYYGCRRRVDFNWRKNKKYRLDENWESFHLWDREEGCPGFFQMFNVNASVLKFGEIYPSNYPTAALSDNEFGYKFGENIVCLNMEVLHLGHPYRCWDGINQSLLFI